MKVINKYIDEISKREFKTEDEAINSEKKNGGIAKKFSFWKKEPEDEGCSFANGGWSYQRKESDYVLLREALLQSIKEYEPWIAKQYDKQGGLELKHIVGGSFIGRYLCDGNSELYPWFITLSNICPICFRQHGQPYHANHCEHNKKTKDL